MGRMACQPGNRCLANPTIMVAWEVHEGALCGYCGSEKTPCRHLLPEGVCGLEHLKRRVCTGVPLSTNQNWARPDRPSAILECHGS